MPTPERLRQLFGALKSETQAATPKGVEGSAWKLFWEQFRRACALPPDRKRREP
jgi:hypothetical protein